MEEVPAPPPAKDVNRPGVAALSERMAPSKGQEVVSESAGAVRTVEAG